MMPAIGVADPLVADDAFSSDSHHAFPSAVLGLSGRSVRIGDETDREDLLSEINSVLLGTEREAEVAVGRKRSAVTLAALAQARVGVNKQAEAIAAARECLNEVVIAGDSNEFDRTSARIAVNVLLEYGEIDAVLDFSSEVPLGDYSKLELASALAEHGRTHEARELARSSQSSLRSAVLGYIELVDGKFAAAVPQLRDALRRSPSDGSSAFNLSVALERLGSPQKALRAALQARASDSSRLDYSLHLIELLFAKKDLDAATVELSRWGKGADSIARVLVAKARLRLMKNQPEPALVLLEKAQEIASKEEDLGLFAEIRSNLLKMRVSRGSISRADALEGLEQLHERVPKSDAVVANWAQVASRRSDSGPLLRAVKAVVGGASDARRMFLQYQICTLNGDNAGASVWASKWLSVEPDNPRARTAYLVALGIGEARWEEARLVALAVLKDREWADSATLNNAAYVLAMSGHSDAAIELVEPLSAKGSVFQATLGLALIAGGNVDRGMKMYRLAADAVEKVDSATRSLMTVYQALIIRQLHLDRTDGARVRALALPAVPLPDDWEDRPEFLRLAWLCKVQGYRWPMVVD